MTTQGGYMEARDAIVNHYVYSHGGLSPFFRALKERGQLTGTRCAQCGTVWCPPRTHCSNCYGETQWMDLSHEGTVRAATYCYYVPSNYALHSYQGMPYVLALVQPDGASTCLYNIVRVPKVVVGAVPAGMRVRAVFRERREGRLTDFYYVPVQD